MTQSSPLPTEVPFCRRGAALPDAVERTVKPRDKTDDVVLLMALQATTDAVPCVPARCSCLRLRTLVSLHSFSLLPRLLRRPARSNSQVFLPLPLCSFRIYALRLRCYWYPAIRPRSCSLDISSIHPLPSTHCRTYMQPSSQLGHKTAGAARALYIMSPGSIGCEHGWICSNATKGYWAMSDR
ncbi:uncharacterized protein C8Q71DRAFT_286502 [Rhodofomes roseus]|uniref:Uncharacterized protein n=1 Tax=Rhodofomes roseus TaxID=34475 RepID=A0ABQ8K4K3_9APHY|nr:uncharacterized protein C8Q71DRAFT_286502 [Rhodofomes roseus]KAH9831822.1 hypothetical protein C8Q71DRAFT_286502 [Rhodofomes roseus]